MFTAISFTPCNLLPFLVFFQNIALSLPCCTRHQAQKYGTLLHCQYVWKFLSLHERSTNGEKFTELDDIFHRSTRSVKFNRHRQCLTLLCLVQWQRPDCKDWNFLVRLSLESSSNFMPGLGFDELPSFEVELPLGIYTVHHMRAVEFSAHQFLCYIKSS